MMEYINEIISDYTNGFSSAADLCTKYGEIVSEMRLGRKDYQQCINKALEPLASYICYVYSDANENGEEIADFNDDYTSSRFDGTFELGCKVTQLELENKNLKARIKELEEMINNL